MSGHCTVALAYPGLSLLELLSEQFTRGGAMSPLPTPAHAGNMQHMRVKGRVQVDFHVNLDGEHTLASTADGSPQAELAAGGFLEATDGDITRPAAVESVDGDTLSLVILWDTPVNVG